MRRLGGLVAALGLVAATLVGYAALVRARADLDGARQQLQRTADSLRTEVVRVDTLYRRDTVRLWRLRERWDTVHVAVDRWKHDTLEVVRYVALADSTIAACSVALLTCEERTAWRDARISNLEAQVRAAPKPASRAAQAVTHALALWLGSRLR